MLAEAYDVNMDVSFQKGKGLTHPGGGGGQGRESGGGASTTRVSRCWPRLMMSLPKR